MTKLVLPLRFRNEAGARACIEGNGLYPLGARPVEEPDGRWRVVITPRHPGPVLTHLRTTMPGVEWAVSDDVPSAPVES